ncbi:gamma-glutamyltranspeptidase 2 [Phtheirospermum japonicum]|uniref:Glutathione hydrolase n=1 Tax=Phtheirospermum japonicum TaxID=374723 RepID=A0A830BHR1_9LAMI|nr:gamma-glutamyltranspeptidase 2 [Phtheirospermum japonicum]
MAAKLKNPWPILAIFFYISLSIRTSCHPTPRGSLVIARSGIIATEETICSNIGKEILVRGGHAVDASVAAAFCLGVVGPPFSGLGGGGFMLVRQDNGEAKVFDMLETAPRRAFKTMFNKHKIDQIRGKLSIAIPGQLAGLYEAWSIYGKLPWNDLVKPAEDLARNGSTISNHLHQVIDYEASMLRRDPMLRSIFTADGRPLKPGNTLIQKTLANTLSEIARTGVMAFYNGPIGQRLVNDIIRGSPGILSMDDLRKYRVKIRKPLTADVMGLQILSAPPPSSGGAVLVLVLKILEQYEIPRGVSGALGTHRTIEALKHALSMRMQLGDPDFEKMNYKLFSMLSTKTAKKLRAQINDTKTYRSDHYGDKWKQVQDHGTTHICVVDKERNVVSMSTSLNSMFGSGYMSPSTGILLNNHMFGFSIPAPFEPPPAPPNFIQPAKRPLSSITPTIILKGGRLKAVVGGAGGIFIPAAVSEVILNHFAKEMDPLSSIMAPRYYPMLHRNMLYYENYSWMGAKYIASEGTLKFLRSRNHNMVGDRGPLSSCVLVLNNMDDDAKLVAVVDARKGGVPAGY